MPNELPKNLADSYGAARSVCRCGHTGDGVDSDHNTAFANGHGSCKVAGCDCDKFRWDGWTRAFEAYIESSMAG